MEKVTVHFLDNSMEKSEIETKTGGNLFSVIKGQYAVWPEHAKIYQGEICQENDITPLFFKDRPENNAIQESVFNSYVGEFTVVVSPGDPVTAVIVVVGIIAIGIAAFTLIPDVPTPTARNSQVTSPNNELSGRSNRERLNGRIPDIFGQVRSTPDLISQTYNKFINNEELEYSYLCVGRGDYLIEDVKDGETPIQSIDGTSVEIYGPGTSPNGGTPVLTIGSSITDPIINTLRINEANGQVLVAPNQNRVTPSSVRGVGTNQGGSSGNPESAGKWRFRNNLTFDWTDFFEIGSVIVVTESSYLIDGTVRNLNGTYTVLEVYDQDLVVSNANVVNSNWNFVNSEPSAETVDSNMEVSTDAIREIGPFFLNAEDLENVYINIVASNGLYKDNGSSQSKEVVDFTVKLEPTTSSGVPIGGAEFFTGTIEGSATVKTQAALTFEMNPTFSGYCEITVYRTSDTNTGFSGTVSDEIKLRDVYIVRPVVETDFGDITTVHARTQATTGALQVKNRKLNMLATRKLNLRTTGENFSTTKTATKNAADIIVAIAMDPYLGNRQVEELDLDSIYDTVQEVVDYFGSSRFAEFCYTFDKDNISLEETLQSVVNTVYCSVYRQGNKIKLKADISTIEPNVLFNHRNKLPGTEKRTVRFGSQNDHDGVELEYVSPDDDAIETLILPEGTLPLNPKKVETIGIRNKQQAALHAWRAYQKILYQNTAVEFTATSEAALVGIGDKVVVADNTNPETQDGELLVGSSGLNLILSQPVVYDVLEEYTLFLQMADGTIESIPIASFGPDANQITLSSPASQPLVTDLTHWAKTTYSIVRNTDTRPQEFLVKEKDPSDTFSYKMSLSNFDERFYEYDNLALFLAPTSSLIEDKSPREKTLVASGTAGASVVTDSVRGSVLGFSEGDKLVVSYDPDPINTIEYTKAFWLKLDSVGQDATLVGTESSTASRDRIWLSPGSDLLLVSHLGVNASFPFVQDTNWHHLAVTFSFPGANNCSFYLDGVLVETKTLQQRLLLAFVLNGFGTSSAAIGAAGKYDDVRYYSKALSAKAIKNLYNETLA